MSDGDEAAQVAPRRGDALSVVSALFAALFLLAFRHANESAPRGAVVLAMLAGSAVFNAGFALSRMRGLPGRPRPVTVQAVVVLGVLTILGNIGVAGALVYLDPGLTAVMMQTQIFFVGLGGWALLGEKITPRFIAGALFAVVGFGVLAIDDPTEADVDLFGVAFALLGSLSFAAMLVYTRKIIARIDPVRVNVLRLLLAVAVMGAYLIPTGTIGALTAQDWILTVVAAFCGPFVSRLALMFAVRHISASRAKLLTLLTPIFAFGLEVTVMGTRPSLRELGGAALILAGVVLPALAGARSAGRADG